MEEITIETPALQFAAKAWGPKDGQPFLALHGWLDNCASFTPLASRLKHCRVIALDFAGHGWSQHRPAGVSYHFIDMVADGFAVANALGWERFGVIGHSMGAGVAALMAGTEPERITHTILIEGIGPATDEVTDAPTTLSQAIRQMQSVQNKKQSSHASLEEAVKVRLLAGKVKESSARLLVERGTHTDPDGISWRRDPRLTLTSRLRLTETQVLAFLENIESPVLVIRANPGMRFNETLLQNRCSRIAQLQKIVIPGGHHLHLDDPAPVANAIQDFLS